MICSRHRPNSIKTDLSTSAGDLPLLKAKTISQSFEEKVLTDEEWLASSNKQRAVALVTSLLTKEYGNLESYNNISLVNRLYLCPSWVLCIKWGVNVSSCSKKWLEAAFCCWVRKSINQQSTIIPMAPPIY